MFVNREVASPRPSCPDISAAHPQSPVSRPHPLPASELEAALPFDDAGMRREIARIAKLKLPPEQLPHELTRLAPAAAQLGHAGASHMQALAQQIYGKHVQVLESAPGQYAVWSTQHRFAPTLVWQVGQGTPPLSAHVEPLQAPPPVGTTSSDHYLMYYQPALRHLADALGHTQLSVQAFFHRIGQNFKQAPDPTHWLKSMHAANQHTHITQPTRLSMLTYNVALLRFHLFHCIPVGSARSPHLEERMPKIAEAIFSSGDDIITLQEVWRSEDRRHFCRVAARCGYRPFIAPRDQYNDGLVTFVKETCIDAEQPVSHRAKAYESQIWKEYWPAVITSFGADVGIKRGYHEVSFSHPKLGPVHVFNTHTCAFEGGYTERMEQARELGMAAGDKPSTEFSFVAGDMNAATYYRKDRWHDRLARKRSLADWWENTISMPLLSYYGRLTDLAVSAGTADEALADVKLADTDSLTPQRPHWPMTASPDSNRLYVMQYGQTEPAARLDHLYARGPKGLLKAVDRQLMFTERNVDVGDGDMFELSDHYGLRVVCEAQRT